MADEKAVVTGFFNYHNLISNLEIIILNWFFFQNLPGSIKITVYDIFWSIKQRKTCAFLNCFYFQNHVHIGM